MKQCVSNHDASLLRYFGVSNRLYMSMCIFFFQNHVITCKKVVILNDSGSVNNIKTKIPTKKFATFRELSKFYVIIHKIELITIFVIHIIGDNLKINVQLLMR